MLRFDKVSSFHSLSLFLETNTKLQPLAAKELAHSNPMPWLAPVTKAILFFNI